MIEKLPLIISRHFLILLFFIQSTNLSAQFYDLRIDNFFGGPVHMKDHAYKIRGEVTYIGNESFGQVWGNWQVNDQEPQSFFFDKIGLNSYIPYRYEFNEDWTPPESGRYELKVWFTGLNGEDNTIAASDTMIRDIQVYDYLPQRQFALLESFSSINCGTCAMVTPALKKIIDDNADEYAQIYYHPLFYENSPVYEFNPGDNDIRKNLYEVFYTPLSVIGRNYFGGSEYVDQYLMQTEKSKLAGFDLSGSWYVSNDTVRVSVQGESFIEAAEGQDFRLLVAAVQDTVSFDEPPGSNGEHEFYNVMRFFVPDANGSILESELSNGDFELDMERKFQNLTQMDTTRLTLYAFVQELNSRSVYQVVSLPMFVPEEPNDPVNVAENNKNNEVDIFPNPASERLFLRYSNPLSDVRVSIYDLTGKKVSHNERRSIDVLDISELQNGIYILSLEMDNNVIRKRFVKSD